MSGLCFSSKALAAVRGRLTPTMRCEGGAVLIIACFHNGPDWSAASPLCPISLSCRGRSAAASMAGRTRTGGRPGCNCPDCFLFSSLRDASQCGVWNNPGRWKSAYVYQGLKKVHIYKFSLWDPYSRAYLAVLRSRGQPGATKHDSINQPPRSPLLSIFNAADKPTDR